MNRLGERIKKKREQFHLQLNDLAKRLESLPAHFRKLKMPNLSLP